MIEGGDTKSGETWDTYLKVVSIYVLCNIFYCIVEYYLLFVEVGMIGLIILKPYVPFMCDLLYFCHLSFICLH